MGNGNAKQSCSLSPMSLLQKLSLKIFRRSIQTNPAQSSAQSSPAQSPPAQSPAQPPAQPLAPRPKTLSEIEREMEAEYKQLRPVKSAAPPRQTQFFSKLIWTGILLGVPIGALWLVNQPYPIIRRPIARHAPFLLTPSYISMDNHYRQAISLVQQATQLIDRATAPADIDLGTQKIEQAQSSLDKLPLWLWEELPGYRYGWYDWRLSYSGFNAARAEIGRLQAKAFQEHNAQTALFNTEQALSNSKQQYQQAKTIVDKQSIITAWRTGLNQLEQISTQTLAGRTAQQKLSAYQQDFQETVGLAAGNARVATQIEIARQYAWKAAQTGQNPPHSVIEWQQVESFWQEAIARLKQIPDDDLAGYAEAQRLLVEYQSNLGQIQIRRQTEEESLSALQNAKSQIQVLLASLPDDPKRLDRNYTASQLQGIINQLERVENGTTAYLEAQQLLLQAKNRLNKI